MDGSSIASSGLLVRHLVMPGSLDETFSILKSFKQEISSNIHVTLMSQYRPMGHAFKVKEFSRFLTPEEFRKARQMARENRSFPFKKFKAQGKGMP